MPCMSSTNSFQRELLTMPYHTTAQTSLGKQAAQQYSPVCSLQLLRRWTIGKIAIATAGDPQRCQLNVQQRCRSASQKVLTPTLIRSITRQLQHGMPRKAGRGFLTSFPCLIKVAKMGCWTCLWCLLSNCLQILASVEKQWLHLSAKSIAGSYRNDTGRGRRYCCAPSTCTVTEPRTAKKCKTRIVSSGTQMVSRTLGSLSHCRVSACANNS